MINIQALNVNPNLIEKNETKEPIASSDTPTEPTTSQTPSETIESQLTSKERESDRPEEKADSTEEVPSEASPSEQNEAETPTDEKTDESEETSAVADVSPEKIPFKDRLSLLAQKRSTKMAAVVLGLIVVTLLTFRWYLFERPVPFKVEATDISVMVSDGDSARRVMDKLAENGLDVDLTTMRLAARFADIDLRRIHAGLYKFEAGLSPVAILEKISQGALADRQLRIPDGAPIWEVMKLIREHDGIKQTTADKSEIEIAALLGLDTPSLEGWLAPDTYHFASGTSDLTILHVALKQQQDRLEKAWATRSADVQVKSLYEALILASIIEKETGNSADRTLISSVFNNRLRIKMPLQTDPTVIYGIGEKFNGNLTRKQLQTSTAYNTYKIQGLPPTPIATPSPASLEAAMHPAKTKFLYFVSRGDGTSEFSTNLKDHNRAVRRYILQRR